MVLCVACRVCVVCVQLVMAAGARETLHVLGWGWGTSRQGLREGRCVELSALQLRRGPVLRRPGP